MVVRLLFFGATADITGKRQLELYVDAPMSASDLLQDIVADYPALHERRLLFSINEDYAAADAILNDGDEVAIFTAVSGG